MIEKESRHMKRIVGMVLALSLASTAYASEDVVTAVHGSVEKIDSTSKTIVVKTDDGVRHVVHFTDRTAVHGADAGEDATKDSWHGLKVGGEAVVHYTTRGTEDSAVEIDKVGDGGLKATEGAVKGIDRDGKVLVVGTKDGSVETFRLTEHATKDGGKGVVKGARVTVFYSETAGNKIAHFFAAP
jgi:hypothetical protein